MSETRWVQHISGQGEKWEVRNGVTSEYQWCVVAHGCRGYNWLPKSEYHLCDPPEVWRDVTSECRIDSYGAILHEGRSTQEYPYRRQKVQFAELSAGNEWKMTGAKWAFIVEKKES